MQIKPRTEITIKIFFSINYLQSLQVPAVDFIVNELKKIFVGRDLFS